MLVELYSQSCVLHNNMQLNLPQFGKSSRVVRRSDNSDETTSSYCGSGFPIPFGSIPGLVDMVTGSCREDMLVQYKDINLPDMNSQGCSLKELTDPSKLNLRKRVRSNQSPSEGGDGSWKPRQRQKLEKNSDVFGHLAAIRRKQYCMESHSQVVPGSPHLFTLDTSHHSLHAAYSPSTMITNRTVTPTATNDSIPEQPFISSYQSPAVGGSNQFSPVIIEGAHFMLPSVDNTQSSYQPTTLQQGTTELGGGDTLVNDTTGLRQDSEEDIHQTEGGESPILSSRVSCHYHSPVTNHTLTPYTTSPSTHTQLHTSPFTVSSPTIAHPAQDRLDVANFSIIRYYPREE